MAVQGSQSQVTDEKKNEADSVPWLNELGVMVGHGVARSPVVVGLPTEPRRPTAGLPGVWETCGHVQWAGQETGPQQERLRHSDKLVACDCGHF